tara:strand:+ start:643 stop:1128 length:486 start_codon:yes stop_codon:yes gene_type:complete
MAQSFTNRLCIDKRLQYFFHTTFSQEEREQFLKNTNYYQIHILKSNYFLCYDSREKHILKSIFLIEYTECERHYLYHVENIRKFFNTNKDLSCNDLVFEPSHLFITHDNQTYVICLNTFQIMYENNPYEEIKTARKSLSNVLIWNILVIFAEARSINFIVL